MKGLNNIYNNLLAAYGPRHWWPAETPYEMMLGAILTQNTSWKNVEKAIANLKRQASLKPEIIVELSLTELAEMIRSSGYYNQKAQSLKALTAWYSKYDYDIEKASKVDGSILRRELLAIKGVGPETADSILTYALEKPFFVVDAYTRRILARFGYDLETTYEGLQEQIERNIPRELGIYNEFHALIVEHAKRHCSKKPNCSGCPLAEKCRRIVN